MSQKKGLKVRRDILGFIDEFTQEHGYAPSVREISKHICVGVGTVQYHLDVLEGHGYIIRQENTSRSVRILAPIAPQTNLKKLRSAVNLAARSRAEGIGALAEMLVGFQQGRVLSVSDWRAILEGPVQTLESPNAHCDQNSSTSSLASKDVLDEASLADAFSALTFRAK